MSSFINPYNVSYGKINNSLINLQIKDIIRMMWPDVSKQDKIINIISTISLSLILIFGCTFNSIVNYNQTYIVVTRSYGINATIFHKRENTSLIITNRDYEFNFNNLNRFLNSQSTSELNEVIILNQSIDVQTTVSALISMYDIEKVIYVNNYSQDSLNSFFKNKINFEHYDFGETYDGIFGNITFVDDGVTVCKNNFKILFANSALDLSNYYADVLIAPSVYEDSEDNFASIYTYNKNNYYLNCVNDGNLVFKIDNGTFKRC